MEGDLHSVVGSKSTPARSTRRQKPERVMEIHLPPNHTPQPPTPIACNLFHSPQSVDLFPPLSYLPAQPVSHAHTLVSFQYLYLRFLSTPFLHLSPHQPNFLSSSSTFSHHPCLPHPLFSPPAGAIPRERKRRSALSQHRFTFLSHSVTPARMQD